MTHLQRAIAYRAKFEIFSPEFTAVDGLIDALIENGTFDYADQYEIREFLSGKESHHA